MARLNSTFLKVNQGDIGFGHLENTTSRKHLDDFSTLSNRKKFFTLHPSNVLIFPASVKLTPHMRRSFGNATCDDAVKPAFILRILFTSFVLHVSIMRMKRF